MNGGQDAVAAIEAAEREKTGIRTLRVGYNKVFGYYLEVSKAYYDLVPDAYIRKQTLANCERFITQELKDLEHTILTAKDSLAELEYRLFCDLRASLAAEVARIQRTAAAVARADVLRSLAEVAAAENYCAPSVDCSDAIEITAGRHPVVERRSGAAFSSRTTPAWTAGRTCFPSSPVPTWPGNRPTCARWRSSCSSRRSVPSSRRRPRASASWIASSRASARRTTSPPARARSWWR
jgi:hypothetical protein